MRTWPTADVARMTGVTARTLRHYDAIGLLVPAETGHGGVRRYGQGELLRLQQILLLKRLGLRLDTIADVIEGDVPEIEALQHHLVQLREDREHLDRLTATVETTIQQLKGSQTMKPETWFEGFTDRYEVETRSRWGDEVVDASDKAVRAMPQEERRGIPEVFKAIHERLAALQADHTPAEDTKVQAVVKDHYDFIEKVWGTTPTVEAYKGLGALYTDDPAFTAIYDEVAEHLAAYLRAGMDHYADANL